MDFQIRNEYDKALKMLHHMPCGIIWFHYDRLRKEREVLYVNEKALDTFGFSSRKEYDSEGTIDFHDYVSQESIDSIVSLGRKLKKDGNTENVTCLVKGRNGELSWAEGTLEIVETPDQRNVIQCTFLDVTKFRMKESEMDALIRSLPGGMAVFQVEDNRVNTVFINDQIAQIAKKRKSEVFDIIKEDPLKIIHKEDQERVRKEVQRVLKENGRFEEEFRIMVSGKRERWVRLTAKKVERKNQDVFFYAVILDITANKKEELQQQKQYEAECRRLEKIERKVISTFRINFTTDTLEYYHATERTLEPVLDRAMSYSQYVAFIAGLIQSKDEAERYRNLMSREHMLERFASGNSGIDIDYRRESLDSNLLWVNNHIRMMNRPGSTDVIGFAYAKDVDVEMNDYTLNRVLMDKLRYVMFQKLYFVTALHYETGKYDIIQFSKNAKSHFPLEGSLNWLLHEMEQWCAGTEERRYLDMIRDEKALQKQMDQMDNDEWVFISKVTLNEKKETWFEFRVIRLRDEAIASRVYLLTASNIDQAKEQEQKLQEALLKAEKASRVKQEFLSHISHEIRTPLNGIKGALDLIKDSKIVLEEQNQELLDAAIVSSNHLTSLINDVLDMSKISEGKMQLYYSWIEMESFLEQLSIIILPMALEKRIKFVKDIDMRSYQLVYSDMGRLKQVFLNMLSNAVKFTPAGGNVKLTARTTILGQRQIHVDFEIVDNGIGMTEDFVERAMEPFEQEERDMSQVGSGLGMSITKQLVELLEGSFDIKSQVGIGTRIRIGFDFKAAKNTNVTLGNQEGKNLYAGLDFKGLRCLIVEDNDINLLIARRLLESMNIVTESAVNGQEAIDMFEAAEEWYYDMIFMDIMMPVKDGITATIEIRALQRQDARNIPIVAMTANAFVEDMNRTFSSGMNYHLSKPFDKEQIQEVLVQEFATELD